MSEYRMKIIYGKILRDGSFVTEDYDRTPYYKSTFTSLIECRKKAYSLIKGNRTKPYIYYIGIEQDKKWCGEVYSQSDGKNGRFLTWIPNKIKQNQPFFQKQRIYVLYSNGKIGEL